jgi:uncharacterized tellurite resistance protein B-like protein
MDTSLVGSEAIELLSRLTGKSLTQQEVTSSLVFQAALVSVLLGVILADKTVTDQEKQKLQTLLNQLASPGSDTRQLLQTLLKGVQQHQVYRKENELLALTASLSESERLLLISLGYQMSASDGDVDSREKAYLQMIASRLGVKTQYLDILEPGLTGQGVVELEALDEVYSLLDPAKFQTLDPLFANAANSIVANLPAKPEPHTKQVSDAYSPELQQSAIKLKEIIQAGFNELNQAENVFSIKRKITDLPQQEILEQLGECSGRYVKIRNLADKLKGQALEQINISWQQWTEVLEKYLSKKWSSDTAPERQTEDPKKLAKVYADEFTQELMYELDNWLNRTFKKHFEILDYELEAIQQNIILFNQKIKSEFGNQILLEIEIIKANFGNPLDQLSENFKGDNSELNLLNFALDMTGSIVGTVTGGIAGVFKFGSGGAAQPSVKQRVFEQGWQKFTQSKDKLFEKIKEIIILVIDERVKSATKIAEQAVSLYEELLEQQEQYLQETAEQQKAEKAWIAQQRQELEQVQKNIEAILPS